MELRPRRPTSDFAYHRAILKKGEDRISSSRRYASVVKATYLYTDISHLKYLRAHRAMVNSTSIRQLPTTAFTHTFVLNKPSFRIQYSTQLIVSILLLGSTVLGKCGHKADGWSECIAAQAHLYFVPAALSLTRLNGTKKNT